MKDFQKSDYAINAKNENAIVYRFADGTIKHITADDFGGDVESFRKWKELSDNDYLVCDRHTYNTTRLDVSIEGIDETTLCSLPSVEEMLIEREEYEQFSKELGAFLLLLTETQKRRLFLAAFKNMGVVEIAKFEGANHKSVCETFINIRNKLKKFQKTPPENGKKITLSERINFYERLIKKKTENE